MKKVKVLISLLVILSMTIGFTLSLRSNQNVLSNTQSSVIDEVSKSLEKWVREMESPFYKGTSVKSVLIKSNIQPDSLSYIIFNVNVQQVLKAQSPEELPMIKGMINCLNSKKPNLKQSQIDYANKELEDQLKELRGYMNKTEELNATFKVEFYMDANYSVNTDSIKFYVETADGDSFLDADVLQPGTPEELEKYGFKRMEKIIEESEQNSLLTICSFHDAYDRIAAGDYADTYTSNPPYDPPNDPNDQYDPGTGTWWDKTHWNTSVYKFPTSSDCADYVSQALYAGGIPMDSIHDASHWWCNRYSTTPPPDYSPWIWVPSLRTYMVNKGYFYSSTYEDANKGNVAIKKDNNHVVMITQNDTINRALSAHMTDRQHYWYSGSGSLHLNPDGTYGDDHSAYYKNNYDFYGVHYIIEVSSIR
jgi:RNA polymerase sigma-70 factor (ECF subfamily)